LIAQEPLKEAEGGGEPIEDGYEQWFSDGVGDSEEDLVLEIDAVHTPGMAPKNMDDIRNSIAALGGTHATILENIGSVAKVVMALQEDVTWLRQDLGVVHEVLEKLAEHVGEQPKTIATVLGAGQSGSPSPSAWGGWTEPPATDNHARAPPTQFTEDERVYEHEESPCPIQRAHESIQAIMETQLFNSISSMPIRETSLPPELLVEWRGDQDPFHTTGMLASSIPQRGLEQDVGDDETQQMEMTIDGPQVSAQAPPSSTWSDYRTAVRDLPNHVGKGGDSDVGWVRSKRARDILADFNADREASMSEAENIEAVNLNLNLSPESLEAPGAMRGTWKEALGIDIPGTSRGGKGAGRGKGRATRPPAIDYNFRSEASVAHMLPGHPCISVPY
jgi:hypothetical protein